jgi:hypothetical protein
VNGQADWLLAFVKYPNTVSGYSIGSNGALTQVPGSPFSALGSEPRALAIAIREASSFMSRMRGQTISQFSKSMPLLGRGRISLCARLLDVLSCLKGVECLSHVHPQRAELKRVVHDDKFCQ